MIKKFYKQSMYGALAICALLVGCGGQQEAGYVAEVPEVDFIKVEPTDASVEKKYPGAIEGTVNVDVKVQVTGYLEAIYIQEGQYVQKGQSLFKIKADVYNEQVSNSQATLKAALAAQESARLEVEKIRPLVEGKVVSELQLKTAEANLSSALAQVAQAKANVGSSEINAAFTLVKAPVSGYIGRIPNRIGNLITPSDETPLTTLSEIDQVFVYFSLSESDFMTFSKDRANGTTGNEVALYLADGSLYAYPGNLEVASGNIDRTTGSIALKATFPNPDRLLRSGGTGKVVLKKNLQNVLTVPMEAVKDIQNKFFVFALGDSSRVEMKPIEVSGRTGDIYLVSKGLQSGEKIALNRIDILQDGMPVQPSMSKTNVR